MNTTIHIPTPAENQAALAEFFGQMKQVKREQREALAPAQAALGRLIEVCAVKTGQSYKVRALLWSLWNGKPANLSDVLCLDWAIRKDLCAVVLALHNDAESVFKPICAKTISDAASLKSPSSGASPITIGSVRSFMRVECAWCGCQLPARPCVPAMAGQVSHGMCAACKQKWDARSQEVVK